MIKINFDLRVKIMASLSFIGSLCLIISLIGLLLRNSFVLIYSFGIYIVCRFTSNLIWRCPKCKSKLPKGKNTQYMENCSYCNHSFEK